MVDNIQFTHDETGEKIVIMSAKAYKNMQRELKLLRKRQRLEEMSEAFQDIKDMIDGKKEGRELFELLDEL